MKRLDPAVFDEQYPSPFGPNLEYFPAKAHVKIEPAGYADDFNDDLPKPRPIIQFIEFMRKDRPLSTWELLLVLACIGMGAALYIAYDLGVSIRRAWDSGFIMLDEYSSDPSPPPVVRPLPTTEAIRTGHNFDEVM